MYMPVEWGFIRVGENLVEYTKLAPGGHFQ